jgi:hypothetical protein
VAAGVGWLMCTPDKVVREMWGWVARWKKSSSPNVFVGSLQPRILQGCDLQRQPNAMAPAYHIGQRISFDSHLCTVRYIGAVAGTQKEWLGVEWDDPTRGKHDGEYQGVRYFSCKDVASS